MDPWESNYTYEPSPLFEQTFNVLPFSKYKNPHLETGDKIIMPPSSLSKIISSRLKYPLLFKIEGYNDDKISHCGVLEFDAEEGFIHMPEWMMKNMNILEGDMVIIRNASISTGRYMKLQPHRTKFIEVSNPRAVLEKALRGFTCLTRGDTIMVRYNEKEFYIDVLDVRPGDQICLIDTDCEVDFAPPLDYKEKKDDEKVITIDAKEEKREFTAFKGKARRLDGEKVVVENDDVVKGIAKIGIRKKDEGSKEVEKETFKAFTGKSYVTGCRSGDKISN